jgi:hypothetical protein
VNIDPGLEFAYVVGVASAPKVEEAVWLDWLPDPAHEVSPDELDDASKLLGWAYTFAVTSQLLGCETPRTI